MSRVVLGPTDRTGRLDRLRRQAGARPLTTVLVPVFAAFYAGVGLPRLLGLSIPEPYLHVALAVLAVTLLFGSACAVTWLADGRAGLSLLLRRLATWRIGWLRLVVVVAALPTLALAIAAVSGSLQRPAGGDPAHPPVTHLAGLKALRQARGAATGSATKTAL
jgi:hypothetical protein